MTTQTLTSDRARYWLERWDRQQEFYIPERDRRFDVIIDVVAQVCDRPDPLVVDLGVGPGSLSLRLLKRMPHARVVGVDADPLLLGLAQAAFSDGDCFRVVAADLREDGWFDTLGLDRAPDAYVSTTALHWLNRGPLRDMLAVCARTLASPGVLVNGDNLNEGDSSPLFDELNRAVRQTHANRLGVDQHEDWQAWWTAVEAAPELADLVAQRAGGFDHTITDRPTNLDWLSDLRDVGFTESGTVWQFGDDRITVGIKK